MPKTRLPYISPDIISEYQGHIRQTSSPSTSKRRMSSLKRFADWAEKEGHIEKSPFQQQASPSPELSREVVRKAKTPSSPRSEALKNFLRVGLAVGMAVLIFLLIRNVKLPIPFIPAPAREGDELVRITPSPSPQTPETSFDTDAIIAQIKQELITQIGGVLEWASFENGNLLIGGSPVSSITLQTGDTTDGDIEINPDGDGIVHFLFEGTGQNFLNAQAPNLTSGSLFYGIVANNSTGYDLLRLQSGSIPTTRFSVDATGDVFTAGLVDSYGGYYTSGVERLTASGALTNITGYSQTSGNFSINQNAGDTATISKTNTTALSDLMVLTLDERPKPQNANSSYSTLVLRRYDGANEAAALYVDVGNAIFDEQVLLGRYATNPASGIGEGSIIYNTVDDTVYVWDGSAWTSVSSSVNFADITSGTNTQAAMVVGTGASLDFTGTGTINASSLNSLTSGQFLRSDTSDNFTSGTLTTDAGTVLDINGDLIVSDTSIVFDATNTTFAITGDLTIDPAGSDVTIDGDLILSDTFTLQVGGLTGTAYNAFANAGEAPEEAAISSDNDLYIGGDLEVDGIIYGDGSGITGVTASSLAWDDLTAPDANLSLSMSTFTTTFSWDSTGNTDLFSFNYDNAGGTAGTDRVLVISNAVSDNTLGDITTEALFVLDQADTTTTGDTAVTDGLLITNSGGSTFTNAITIGSGSQAIGTALNIASTGVTTDIRLQNGETIDNNTDGTILLTSPTTSLSGDLAVNGGDITTTSTTLNIDVANTGTINFRDGTNALIAIKDQGVYPFLNVAGKTDTGDPATCAEGDIYYNAFDDTIKICHTANTWEALDGSDGSAVWSSLTDPTADLTLNMAEYETLFNWDLATDAALDGFSLTLTNDLATDTSTQRLLVLENSLNAVSGGTTEALLLLDQTDTTASGNTTLTDGLLITNSGGSTFTNAITVGSGSQAIGTALNIASTGVTTDIRLQNGETIDNNTDGTVNLTTTTLLLTGGTTLVSDQATVSVFNTTTTTLNIGGVANTLSIGSGTSTTTVNNDLVVSGELDVNGAGTSDIAGTLNLSGSSLTSTGDLTIDAAGSQVIFADGDTLNVGGLTGVTYNAFANAGEAPEEAAISSDNDLYIGGDLEVDGTIYGTVSGAAGSVAWDDITAPDGNLTLAMGVFNTTFNWGPGADSAETAFSLTIQGEDTTAGGDEDQILLTLVQTDNSVDVDQAADALLTFTNNDPNDPVVNAIRFDAGAAGTDFTYGINFDAATFGTAELILSNSATIANTSDGTLALTEPTIQLIGSTSIDIDSPTIDLSTQTVDVTLNSAVDSLNFDSNTLSVDALNNRVGIGTAAPSQKLTVQQDAVADILGIYDGANNTSLKIADAGVTTFTPTAFDSVQNFDGVATYTDNTTEAKTNAGTAYTILAVEDPSNDEFYMGLDHPFATINFDIQTAGVGVTLVKEYYNGAWTALTVTDNTTNLTVDGTITFTAPSDWTTVAVNGTTKYWVRLRSSTAITTAPTANFTSPTTGNRLYAYGQAGDSNAALYINDYGNVGIGTNSPTSLLSVGVGSPFRVNSSGQLSFVPGATGTYVDFVLETEWTAGTLINADFASATTQTADATGMLLDFNTNFTGAADADLTGVNVRTPALSIASGATTTTYRGLQLGTAGALTASGTFTGTIDWRGLDISMPNITQIAGSTVNAFGINGSNGSITTEGTQNIFNASATGVGAGNLNALNISNITGGAGTEYAIRVGTGWDDILNYNGTTIIDGDGSIPGGSIDGFIQGSVIFADSSGFLDEDNANFFWDDTNNFLGINNNAPSASLHIGGNAETHSLGSSDVLVSSDIELDGVLYLDGGTISNVAGTGTILFSSTPITTANSLSAGSWLVDNTANVGLAALIVNQTHSGDIFSASASAGTNRFRIANNGTVTITTTNAASTASLVVNDSSGTGTGKIDVGTVDPPYTINGKKYATFLSGIIGVKEEVVGTLSTNEYIPGLGYRTIVDFNNLPEASDLWLFGKTTNIKEQIGDMVALLTPSTPTRTWYEVDEENAKIAIYSARPTNISFRFTAPRFDADYWSNTRDEDSEVEGFVLNNPDTINTNPFISSVYGFSDFVLENVNDGFYVLKDASNQAVDGLEAAGNFIAANIKAGAIEAEDLTTNSFLAFQARIDNLLVTTGLVSPVVQTALISPLPDETDITVKIGKEGTDEGKLAVQNSEGEEVASIDTEGNAEFKGDLRAGKIYADEVVGALTLEEIEGLLKQAQEDQVLMENSDNWNVNTATESGSFELPESLALTNLYVTGSTALSSLSVADSIAIGSDLVFQSSTVDGGLAINSIDTLSSPLQLQSLALAPVEIMAGLVRIDTNGDVTITGNLFVAGQIESQGLSLQRPEESGFGNLLTLKDALGNEVGIIDASGSAKFASIETGKLIVAGANQEELSLNANGEIETNAVAGVATIAAGQEELVIRNPNITNQTLVYITPTSTTQNKVLFVKSKGNGYFTAGFTNPLTVDVSFNWWVIDTNQGAVE